jgi:predicted  nucleic acid-binding Zn-ribbon protein
MDPNHAPWEQLENEIKALKEKVEKLERRVQEKRPSLGSAVWVLVPVVAIIMWGLTTIFD